MTEGGEDGWVNSGGRGEGGSLGMGMCFLTNVRLGEGQPEGGKDGGAQGGGRGGGQVLGLGMFLLTNVRLGEG